MNQEPVSLVAAITAAVQATLALLLFVGVSAAVVGGLQVAAVAWIVVGAVIARGRVTPVENVALTVEELRQLEGYKPNA